MSRELLKAIKLSFMTSYYVEYLHKTAWYFQYIHDLQHFKVSAYMQKKCQFIFTCDALALVTEPVLILQHNNAWA